ncbi:MAG: hypothetical protein PQJ58_17000 [Spirochaetales bacterium]|nr:hypothetical protein [Spirochaetales bacterium]
MQIDGDTSDWDDVPVIRTDNTGELASSGDDLIAGSDLYEIKMVQDVENIYFYYSTIDGAPLSTTGIELHNSFSGDEYNIQFNISHSWEGDIQNQISSGVYGVWGNFDYWGDEPDVAEGNIPDPAIRFAGIDPNSNSMEYAISKRHYWDYAYDNELRFNTGTWLKYYEYLYTDGGGDNLDETSELIIRVKDSSAQEPSFDLPLLQFKAPSSALNIDGSNSDLSIWTETGAWFRDFSTDDLELSESNTNIESIYIKQDSANIYILLLLADAATFNASGFPVQYIFNVEQDGGTHYHQLVASHDGATTWTFGVDYEFQGVDGTGCNVQESDGYVEMTFAKSGPWGAIPDGNYSFNLEVYDSVSDRVDSASFLGYYN